MLPLHLLLRAAVLISQRKPAQIALQTGIRRSRVERILYGRTLPRPNEPRRILESCGIDGALLTSPSVIRRKGSVHSEHILDVLLLHRHAEDVALVNGDGDLFADKLALTFDTFDERALIALAEQSGGLRLDRKKPMYLYEYACKGIFVQHGKPEKNKRIASQRRRTSRVEFNPANLRSGTAARFRRALLQSVLSLARPRSIRVSRLDVKVDIPVPIARVQCLGSERAKVNVWIGTDGVETINIGQRGSERQVRIYDRVRKAFDDGRLALAHKDETRFEVQLRNVGGGIDDLAQLENPFARLRLFELQTAALPLIRALPVLYASTFAMTALKHALSDAEYRQLLKDVEQTKSSKLMHPAAIFNERWPSVVTELHRLIKSSRR